MELYKYLEGILNILYFYFISYKCAEKVDKIFFYPDNGKNNIIISRSNTLHDREDYSNNM